MFCLYYILLLCVVTYCIQDGESISSADAAIVFVQMFCLYFILSLCVVTYCIQDGESIPSVPCTNGMIYEDKCFIADIGSKVNYDGGVAVCKSLGGHLANIYSQTHMDDVMKYIRENRMGGSFRRDFHLGMKYDPKGNKLTLRDGTDAPAGLKWSSGYPFSVEARGEDYASDTYVVLRVLADSYYIVQYLYNSDSYDRYVICEIE